MLFVINPINSKLATAATSLQFWLEFCNCRLPLVARGDQTFKEDFFFGYSNVGEKNHQPEEQLRNEGRFIYREEIQNSRYIEPISS